MTKDTLDKYYASNQERYKRMALCSSVPELLLKIEIQGKKWSQWDWALLFVTLASCYWTRPDGEYGNKELLEDMVEAIDGGKDLDGVLTNKMVLLNVIHCLKSDLFVMYEVHARATLLNLLAHLFKKFPSLWTMQWMFSRFKDKRTMKMRRKHKLASWFCVSGQDGSSLETQRKRFIEQYLTEDALPKGDVNVPKGNDEDGDEEDEEEGQG